jgi:hypothetical protein
MNAKGVGIAEYLDLTWLLGHEFERQGREQNRMDGLESGSVKNSPIEQLRWWMYKYRYRIKEENARQIEEMLRYVVWLIVVGMFLAGLGAGRALLEYGGGNLVNVVGFFVVLVMVPLFFSLVSLGVLLKSFLPATRRNRIPLPIRLLLDLLRHLPLGMREKLDRLFEHEKLMQSLGVTYLQYGSIAFSLGALSALMVTITTQDIAFGWYTTLDISPETMHRIMAAIALPWSAFWSDAVPSMELVTISRHFRLGNEMAPELIAQAKTLGSWWKFLALSLLVWGVSVRIVLVLLARYRCRQTMRTLLLSNHNAVLLLKYMNESYITTRAPEHEAGPGREKYPKEPAEHRYAGIRADTVIGWNLDEGTFEAVLEQERISAGHLFSAGGKNTIEEDDGIIENAGESVVVVVKAWETPMREFLDFISDLGDHPGRTVSVCPVGSSRQNYRARRSDIDIWKAKIASLHQRNIGVSREAF